MNEAPPWLWGLLVGLLFLSGFFSSSETAFFSLAGEERARASRPLRAMLRNSRRLLVTVLLCNLVVNVSFFAFAARLVPPDDGMAKILVGLGALMALLVCGEILPKTLALAVPTFVAKLATPGMGVAYLVLYPFARPVLFLLDRVQRSLDRFLRPERGITPDLLAKVMERGAEDGHLLASEADLLTEIIELDDIRVREIMKPRVDTLFLELSGEERDGACRRAVEQHQTWLPVIDGDPDHVVGRVAVRDLLRKRERPVRQLVMPVKFVPEVASAMDLLRSLHEDRTSEAVVVDEWGGTAGFVTAEDVFEEIVGDLRTEDEARVPAVVPLGEGRFRVSGGLPIRDWNEHFGLEVVPRDFETVGGFVTALLGRIPRAGDEVSTGELSMLVHEVRGRRVVTVDIGIQAEERRPGAPGGDPPHGKGRGRERGPVEGLAGGRPRR